MGYMLSRSAKNSVMKMFPKLEKIFAPVRIDLVFSLLLGIKGWQALFLWSPAA
jgi:hypothetical protein